MPKRDDSPENISIITSQSRPCLPSADMNKRFLGRTSVLWSQMHGLNICGEGLTVVSYTKSLKSKWMGGQGISIIGKATGDDAFSFL